MKISKDDSNVWPDYFQYGYCHRYRKGINDEANGNIQVEQTGSGYRSKWIPSDTPVRYEQLKDKVQKFGYTEDNVTYDINNHGFRHPDVFVESTNSIVFLGCSITFGIGVNYEETFAYKVAEHFSMDCINLGQPGSTINACYRHAKVWLPIIKPANESATITLNGLSINADKTKPITLNGRVKISRIKYSFKSVKNIMTSDDKKIEKNNAFKVKPNFK